jgi:hypothetical protein
MNEDIGESTVRLIRTMKALVKIDGARIEQLSGKDTVERFKKYTKVSSPYTRYKYMLNGIRELDVEGSGERPRNCFVIGAYKHVPQYEALEVL